jgi:hypothetical protein
MDNGMKYILGPSDVYRTEIRVENRGVFYNPRNAVFFLTLELIATEWGIEWALSEEPEQIGDRSEVRRLESETTKGDDHG